MSQTSNETPAGPSIQPWPESDFPAHFPCFVHQKSAQQNCHIRMWPKIQELGQTAGFFVFGFVYQDALWVPIFDHCHMKIDLTFLPFRRIESAKSWSAILMDEIRSHFGTMKSQCWHKPRENRIILGFLSGAGFRTPKKP